MTSPHSNIREFDFAGGHRHADWLDEIGISVDNGQRGLLARQQADGHWVGELEGDSILESEFILLLAFLGQRDDARIPLLANYLKLKQLPSGGWPNYPGGEAEVSVSAKAYFALKIAGCDASEPFMRSACAAIRAMGGAEATNSFTRFYFALLGQVPYSACPSVPAEIILLPRWFFFNIYAMSAWSRTIFVPLSIVDAKKPVTRLPETMGIRELFLEPPETPRWPARPTAKWFSWTNCFLGIDWAIKKLERFHLTPLRRRAGRKALAWMRERYRGSDGVGAIFPPMVYNAIVLKSLGVEPTDPEMQWVMRQLADLCIREGDTLRLQPCLSPVWDTALSLIAVADAGLGVESPHGEQAMQWLLNKEVLTPGDWAKTVRGVEPGGWFFEYRNAFYPDTDDTAMVLIALARSGHATRVVARPAVHRALNWLLAMQNSDGGWAAFDRNIDNEVLTKVPFADHNAMLDPSCPDITARVLEALSHYGYRVGQLPVDRGIDFIVRRQEENGSWFGRWGVNYIYGTWQVLVGLAAVGYDTASPIARRAARWLKEVQNADGGWGESCRSYDEPALAGEGPSTPSQTAWAILGLIAIGDHESPEVHAGIEYLIGTQESTGGWSEEPFTGTGFPRVFYLKYHLYPVYFPLMALSRYLKGLSSEARLAPTAEAGYRLDGASAASTRRFHTLAIPAQSQV